jgi:hypothetical protein
MGDDWMTAKRRIFYILIAIFVLGILAIYQHPANRTAPVTAEAGQGPHAGAFRNPPKFQIRGGSNGDRYVVQVAYLGPEPVSVHGFTVNGRTGSDGCDTDAPEADTLLVQVHSTLAGQLSKLPLDMQTGDAFTFTLWPTCGQTLVQIAIRTDNGDVAYGTDQ